MKLKNNALQELYDTLVSGNLTISPYAESPIDKAFRECDEKIQSDVDAKVRLHFLTHSRDDWKRRVEHAEDEVEALKKDNEDLEKRLMETTEAFEKVNSDRSELQKDRDSYHELYTELSKTYDKLKARIDCLSYAVEWYRKHYKEQSDKIENLKKKLEYLTSQYQKLTIENKRLQDGLREIGYEQGQTDIWVKLQNVKDMKPEEFDPECETLGDILDMDLEDFLDTYKKWQEEKHLDYMRDYLERFCRRTLCYRCPLHTKEFNCSRGKWLTGISDKDVKRYYDKVGSCDIPIKDLGSWECTLEAKIELNKDLAEKVFGVKLDN